ncbi:MAG: SpoIVB peptidase [Clostridiales bacterium]|nr:SpoIVB peptidase [Clostridiales bacterium]
MLLWDDGRVIELYRMKLSKLLVFIVCCTIISFSLVTLKISQMPDRIMLLEGEQHLFDIKLPVNVSLNFKKNDVVKLNGNDLNGSKVNLNLLSPFKIESNRNGKVDFDIMVFGVIPIKRVTVNVVPQIKVIPGGQSIGVKMMTKGVMVVGVSQINGSDGKIYNPSLDAGIEIGDSILKINDIPVEDGDHVSRLVGASGGKPIKLTIIRKGKEIQASITPVKSNDDQQYKIGAWIRDSTAGVGTLTFYCPLNGAYGAIGHPITDIDTGEMLSVSSGKIVPSKIISVQPGVRGKPGELRGLFIESEDELGNISKNTACGIYGVASKKIENNIYTEPISVAFQSDIKEGPAKILTTVDGTDVKSYDIVIEKLTNQAKPNPKSMIIRITDPELLQKTGGIVQGMSGSPIIQNGKLVGAVTHVFINRPDMGYGIYIEWMLQEAGISISQK